MGQSKSEKKAFVEMEKKGKLYRRGPKSKRYKRSPANGKISPYKQSPEHSDYLAGPSGKNSGGRKRARARIVKTNIRNEAIRKVVKHKAKKRKK